jgi:chaperonin cofactor prefoldin
MGKLSNQLREQKKTLSKASDEYHKQRRMLRDQTKRLRYKLSSKNVDEMINDARVAMKGSWNTIGLKRGISGFFEQAEERIGEVRRGAADLSIDVDRIYARFKLSHGLELGNAPQLEIDPFIADFEKLNADASQFRDSMILVMTEQHYVIRRFFISVASRARRILDETNFALRSWSKAILAPVKTQIDEKKQEIDHRLDNIAQMQSSHDDIELRVSQIEGQVVSLRDKINTLKSILQRIDYTD